MHACTHTHARTHMYMYTHKAYKQTHTYTYIRTHAHTCTYIYTGIARAQFVVNGEKVTKWTEKATPEMMLFVTCKLHQLQFSNASHSTYVRMCKSHIKITNQLSQRNCSCQPIICLFQQVAYPVVWPQIFYSVAHDHPFNTSQAQYIFKGKCSTYCLANRLEGQLILC